MSAVTLAQRVALVKQGADRTWDNSLIYIYVYGWRLVSPFMLQTNGLVSTLELCIGLICSCLPVILVPLKGLIKTWNTT